MDGKTVMLHTDDLKLSHEVLECIAAKDNYCQDNYMQHWIVINGTKIMTLLVLGFHLHLFCIEICLY